VVNLLPESSETDWITAVQGDACDLRDAEFDPVYSNSLIAHLRGHARRCDFASVVHAMASHHWVQTPYRYFPIEPHWLSRLAVSASRDEKEIVVVQPFPLPPRMYKGKTTRSLSTAVKSLPRSIPRAEMHPFSLFVTIWARTCFDMARERLHPMRGTLVHSGFADSAKINTWK
jgi:hypothetical protein